MYFKLADKIGVYIEDKFIEKYGAQMMDVLAQPSNEKEFSNCAATLSVGCLKQLNTEGCMPDGDSYFSATKYIDTKLGVEIEKLSETAFSLKANQDCAEWFMCMLEVTMLSAGLTFAHCAAMEKDGQALFMPARGGVGKTATVVKMVQEHGWHLMGDDLVILDRESGAMYAYPKKFVIYGYHKDLFPQLFEKGKGPVRNDAISHMMTKMIPTAKKVLRMVPGALAYARAHNPQQIRVYPKDIFKPEELAVKADGIKKTVWLERVATENVVYADCTPENIASRCAAITLSELTYGSMNLNDCLFTMCGGGMLDYAKIYNSIYETVLSCIRNSETHVLSIPKSVHIDNVSDVVFENVGVE